MARRGVAFEMVVLVLAMACGTSGGESPGADQPASTGSRDDGTTTGPVPGTASGPGTPSGDSKTSAVGATSNPGTTEESSDSGVGFVEVVDFGTAGEGSECSPVIQNCEEGFKCVWYVGEGSVSRRDNARCIPVTGERAPFESCSLPTGFGPEITDDCGADSYCLEVYGTADQGYCAPFARDRGCQAYPGTLPVFENGSAFPAACLLHPCHPLDSSTCPQGTRCMHYPASLYANAVCWSDELPADLPVGAACDFGSCGDGRLCAPSSWLPGCEHDRCCTQWCDVQAGTTCDLPGTTCGSFHIQQANDAAFDNVGACLLPDVFDR